MRQLKDDMSGFGGLEIVLVLITVGLVGFIGWYAYSHRSEEGTSVEQKTAQTPLPHDSSADVSAFVNKFYKQYYQVSSSVDTPLDTTQLKALVAASGTQKLVEAYADAVGKDPVLCAQNMPTKAPQVISSEVQGATTLSVVRTTWERGPDQTIKVTTLGRGDLKIDSITCGE